MASRAILRRKRFVSDYLNVSTRSILSFQSLEHGHFTQYSDLPGLESGVNHPSSDLNCIKDRDTVTVTKEELPSFSGIGIFSCRCNGITISSLGNGRSEFTSPMGIRWMMQSIRNASTATAGHPEFSSDDEENEELVAKKRNEASPEDCDQAVEGLSTAKAKAKAKQLQESQKGAISILQRVWVSFLGIGPALTAVASMSREDWAKKLAHWKDEFISTLQHYWLGFKLLWADVRICSRLLLKLAGGKSLSRRERQQLTRTTADIFRLVPFAVFIIVPFMEFLLPVFLKLFPNMLPSTFQDKMKEQEALKRRLKARIEYAKFLQDTAKEMAKEVQNSRSGEIKKTAEDLDGFLNRVRTGARVSNEEILGFAKLFNDELTLDNISRPRLVNMCKYMGISPYGTDSYLRYMLRKRLQRIKNDDKLIQAEGVESLSEAELREDCRERGMLGLFSVEEMRQQLRDWLDLSLNHSVPSSLLILSRAFTVSGKLKTEEDVGATLSSLPMRLWILLGLQLCHLKILCQKGGGNWSSLKCRKNLSRHIPFTGTSHQHFPALCLLHILSLWQILQMAIAMSIYDYESFVEVSKRVMQGRNHMQQEEVVREVLLSMLPPVWEIVSANTVGCRVQCCTESAFLPLVNCAF